MSVCPACGSERTAETPACPACGAAETSSVAPTFSPAPSPPVANTRRHDAGSGGIDHGAFAPGSVLAARYRIVGLLGRGGMGEVYRADDLTLGQTVALKFLRGGGDESSAMARLREETRTARQVSHPNVCRVHDVGEWDGRPFVSMEYVDGEDLASLLRRIGRLSPDKALDIVRQVCAGLAAAHDRGVLHRDLKPANVMLDGRGKVRITDFGLASFADDNHVGQIAGTPAYMAPEQIAGGRLSPATDLYATGLLLYELLSGTPAFGTSNLAERRRHAAQSAPPLPASVRSTIDPQIVQVIDRCLELDPARRPSSALALAATLPGGDPLAAALAAGETPAPHVVAAAPDSGGLSPARAFALAAAFAVGVVAQLALSGMNVYSRFVPFRYSPEVLAARAQDVVRDLGYGDEPVDTAHGFVTRTGYIAWRRAQSGGPLDWESLRSVRPQPTVFWYRDSPELLVSPVFSQFGAGPATLAASSPQPITELSPPPVPGERYVELDPDGTLNTLVVSPKASEAAATGPVDWAQLFKQARLDAAMFSPVDALPLSPVFADERAAWVGPAPDGSGVQLRVEAAAFAGRPVYFRIVAPWTSIQSSARVSIETVLFSLLFFALVAIGAALARRNLQQGKTDQQGAVRVAAVAGLLIFTAQMLEAHHPATGEQVFVVMGALSWSLFVAAFSWLTYVALEPYVRKHWPHALIGWTRLLTGRWRDQRVARDLLIGAVVGLAGVFIDRASITVAGWRTGDSVLFRVDLDALGSSSAMIAAFLRSLAVSTAFPIDLLFLLLLLRVFSPRSWMAPVVAVGILVAIGFPAFNDPVVQLPLAIASAVLPVFLLTRYGLLAGATAMFMDLMSLHAIVSLDRSPFFAGTMVAGVMLMAAPVIVGLYAALAGRSLVAERLDLSEAVGTKN